MFTGIRKIERYSLICPILLSPLSSSVSAQPILSLTKNISAQGAYVSGCPQWVGSSQMFASIFYEISFLAQKEAESRFLMRFRSRAIRNDDDGFALEFFCKDMILPLSKQCNMSRYEIKAAEMIECMLLTRDFSKFRYH
ncbi:MAG: hypothetical protein QNK24_06090 [Desulfuromusa sp.]|nr:hypothetical protein [Desulfuromusa sp.]